MRGKVGILFGVVMALLIVGSPAFAQYGVFDKAADWYSPESPRGNIKVAGTIEVNNGVYTIEGNGDDIWNNDDEGFFVYTEKSGDWRLSARVNWIDPGPNEWSKIGVMIREKGDQPGSRHYQSALRGAGYGDSIYAQWRFTENSASGSAQIYEDPPANTIAVEATNEGIWLRVTRISAIGMLISEWSLDGKLWNTSNIANVQGWADTVAYGLAITSHEDSDYLVWAEVDNVKLEQAPSVVNINRAFDAITFKGGQDINVTLNAFYTGAQATQTTITETLPKGMNASNISDGGTLNNGVITWNYTAQPGPAKLTYKVSVPTTYDPATSGYGAKWVGTVGADPIGGQTSAFFFNMGIGDEIFSFDFENANQYDAWDQLAGTWDVFDGLYYEIADAGGPLVTLTGDPELTDCVITVDGMGLVADADWGIVFRATDISNFYSWQFVNGGLELLIYNGGTRTTLYTEVFAEQLNVWQKFQVYAKGSVFYLLFDGVIHAVVENSVHAAGQVGLFGWVNGGTAIPENQGGIVFDNLTVSSLSEATGISEWSLY